MREIKIEVQVPSNRRSSKTGIVEIRDESNSELAIKAVKTDQKGHREKGVQALKLKDSETL